MTESAPRRSRTQFSPLKSASESGPVVETKELTKTYGVGEATIVALNEVTMGIGQGEFVALLGPSGSGKSTLLRCLSGLESPSAGSVVLDGQQLAYMKKRQLRKLRRDQVGLLFASCNLVSTLTVRENILLSSEISQRRVSQARLDTVVEAVGVRDYMRARPSRLSAETQQRVACARALLSDPTVIFADEPTGNLDSQSTEKILQLLRLAVTQFHQTLVVSTHDPRVAAVADRVLFLVDGRVAAECEDPTLGAVLDNMQALVPEGMSEKSPHTEPTQEEETVPLADQVNKLPPAPTEPPEQLPEVEQNAPHSPEQTERSPQNEPNPLTAALEQIAPSAQLPEETVKVIDRAQQILQELPGSVVDDEPDNSRNSSVS